MINIKHYIMVNHKKMHTKTKPDEKGFLLKIAVTPVCIDTGLSRYCKGDSVT